MGSEDPYIDVQLADGGHRLVEKIGEGAMGAVYRGVHEGTGEVVAVKILHLKYALEREFVQRFRREAKILRRLRHPNTVRILDDGQMEDGSLYLVMELLEGRGLDQALQSDGPWPLDRAIPLVLRVARALEEAHRLGVVHRDLKPENIFLARRPDGSEIPKLLDFGLAKLDRSGDTSALWHTLDGDILGTPAFMAPEQSFGEPLDGRADIYSLAVILYELLTGELPFEDGPLPSSQVARHMNEPIPIDGRVEGLTFPPELWPVLARALQKLPDDRFSTAGELAEALLALHVERASMAPPSLRARPAGSPPAGPVSAAPPSRRTLRALPTERPAAPGTRWRAVGLVGACADRGPQKNHPNSCKKT